MKLLPLTAIAFLAMSSAAFALTVDNTTGTNKDGSAKFNDPDANNPFPHASDDGSQQPASNFQMQPVGNSGLSFGISGGTSPNNSQQPDAFERARERMQQ